jgi:hypothetical protein
MKSPAAVTGVPMLMQERNHVDESEIFLMVAPRPSAVVEEGQLVGVRIDHGALLVQQGRGRLVDGCDWGAWTAQSYSARG